MFSESSYGFRPNRGALEAVLKSSEYIKSGREWVVDIDLKSFFDKINHDRLMQRLSKGIGDKRLLRLIRKFLKTGILARWIRNTTNKWNTTGWTFIAIVIEYRIGRIR